jgi:branched-chain amino acid transport system substrate-binding protein
LESPYPLAVAAGEGFVWVLNGNTATVTKIDPEQRTVAATIPIGIEHGPARIAVGDGAVWVANGDGTLARIDARTDAVETISVGHTLKDVVVVGGRVWVTAGSGLTSGTGTAAPPTGGNVRALATSFCAPVSYGGGGQPQFLIASDLPLQGGSPVAQLGQAIELVLRRHGFRAGPYAVGYQSCDDSTAPLYAGSKAKCAANAHSYAENKSVIGVIGSFLSWCSQIELPVLNRAPNGPLAMISPSNTYVGLTRAGPGTLAHEPGRYYPTGTRSYVRVIARDSVQGAADALLARQLGARTAFVLSSTFNTSYARGLAAEFEATAKQLGLRIVGTKPWDHRLQSYKKLAAEVRQARPDTVFLAGGARDNGIELLKDLHAALGRGTRTLAPEGFADFDAVIQQAGAAAEGLTVSVPGLPTEQLPRAGKQFVAEFSKAVGQTPGPYAIYAAQAAEVLLDAIARSDGSRPSITAQLFKTKVTNGILGSFSFDAKGDTTSGAVTIYRIVHGAPKLLKVITPPSQSHAR